MRMHYHFTKKLWNPLKQTPTYITIWRTSIRKWKSMKRPLSTMSKQHPYREFSLRSVNWWSLILESKLTNTLNPVLVCSWKVRLMRESSVIGLTQWFQITNHQLSKSLKSMDWVFSKNIIWSNHRSTMRKKKIRKISKKTIPSLSLIFRYERI